MLTVINDTHRGVTRSAGTTPASQQALRAYSRQRFKDLLPSQGDLMIVGDLFDTHNVPIVDVLSVYEDLADWLATHPSAVLINVAGNHDASKTSTVMSSFQFIGRLLTRTSGTRYIQIEEPQMTNYGYVIPHLRNQEVFDLALAAVPVCNRLFLHCNIDNFFAAQSDQSLNMSAQQIVDCKAAEIICAHEHNSRRIGKVLLPGNQIPTSVSDWLDPQDKFYTQITGDTTLLMKCADRSTDFVEMDWQSMSITDHKFVRIVGQAQPDEIAGAITKVNRLRQAHPALVITNAIVTVTDAVDNAAVFADSLDSVQRFSVTDAIRRLLTVEEYAAIESL